jgi:hypothetical protein
MYPAFSDVSPNLRSKLGEYVRRAAAAREGGGTDIGNLGSSMAVQILEDRCSLPRGILVKISANNPMYPRVRQ